MSFQRKLLAVLTLVFLFSASFGFAERATIRYLTYETSYQQIALLKKIIAEFEKRHPDIHVQLEATTEASRVFLTEMAAGTPPDVMYVTTDYLAQLVQKRAVLGMSDRVARDKVDLNLYYPQIVNSLTFDGNLYAFPIHYSTNALFYNKRMFDKNGIPYPDESWTWHDFKKAATKLTVYKNGRQTVFGCLGPDPQVLILSWGGKIVSDDTQRIVIDSPESRAAMEWSNSMTGKEAPEAAQVQDTNDMQLFANEKLAMFVGRTWQLPQIEKTMPTVPWDVAPVPKGKIRYSIIAVGGNCIARGSRNPDAAWEFVKFYSSLEGQKLLGVQKNCTPALQELAESTSYFLTPPPQHIQVFQDAVSYSTRPVPDTPWSPEFISRVWEPSMERLRTKLLQPAETLALIQKNGNLFLDRYRLEQSERASTEDVGDTTAFLFNFMIVLIIIGFLVLIVVARTNRKYWEGYMFISPWLIGFIVFTLGPVIASLWLSFNRYDMLTQPKWVGFGNFIDLFHDPLFQRSLINTLYYSAFTVPLSLICALLLAMLLNNKLKGIYTFRAIYYLPAITSGVAISLLWRWLFNPDLGLINAFLAIFGIHGPGWLTSPVWAMPAIIIMSVWGGLGGAMLIYLAGLQGIPEQLYEAANLDGANKWQQFWNVTIPMLSPTIFFNLIMSIIGSFQVFVTIFVMTSNAGASIEPGGPANSTLVYVLYLYRTGFRYLNMGSACAMAWILFLIILGLTLLNLKLSEKWVHYEQM